MNKIDEIYIIEVLEDAYMFVASDADKRQKEGLKIDYHEKFAKRISKALQIMGEAPAF